MTDELVLTALAAADAAADIHRHFAEQRDTFRVVEKGQSDFVSEVDLAAQEAALSLIRSRYPEHEILAEEDDASAALLETAGATVVRPSQSAPKLTATAAPTWIVDPLDGTTNFLHDHPLYAASVAVAIGGRAVAGAVVAAATGERWWASEGRGAFLNGQRIQVSEQRELRNSLIGTGFPFKNLPLLPEYLNQLGRVLPSTSGIRRLGSAALDLCYLATGRLDAFWELELGAWDVAAGMIIVEEAGGIVTSLDGEPVDLTGSGAYLAANSPLLHQGLHRLVRSQ